MANKYLDRYNQTSGFQTVGYDDDDEEDVSLPVTTTTLDEGANKYLQRYEQQFQTPETGMTGGRRELNIAEPPKQNFLASSIEGLKRFFLGTSEKVVAGTQELVDSIQNGTFDPKQTLHDSMNHQLAITLEDKYNRLYAEDDPNSKKAAKLNEDILEIETALSLPADSQNAFGKKYLVASEYQDERKSKSVLAGISSLPSSMMDMGAMITEFFSVGFEKLGVGEAKKDFDINPIEEWAADMRPTNPDFSDAVAEGVGSMVAFMGVAMLTGNVVPAGVDPKVVAKGTMAVLEALQEGSNVYADNRDQGKSVKDSMEAFSKDFLANLIINYITDDVLFQGNVDGKLIKDIVQKASAEGVQEGLQQLTSNLVTGRPPLQGVGESMGVGALLGGGVAVTGVTGTTQATEVDTQVTEPGVSPTETPATQALTEQDADVEAAPEVTPERFIDDGGAVTEQAGDGVKVSTRPYVLELGFSKETTAAQMTAVENLFKETNVTYPGSAIDLTIYNPDGTVMRGAEFTKTEGIAEYVDRAVQGEFKSTETSRVTEEKGKSAVEQNDVATFLKSGEKKAFINLDGKVLQLAEGVPTDVIDPNLPEGVSHEVLTALSGEDVKPGSITASALRYSGRIRVSSDAAGLSIEISTLPNQTQMASLAEMAEGKKVFYDISDQSGKVVASGEGDFQQVSDAVRENLGEPAETIGAIQEGTEPPDLTKYNDALSAGNLDLATEIASEHAGDTRFDVHKGPVGELIRAGQAEAGPQKITVYRGEGSLAQGIVQNAGVTQSLGEGQYYAKTEADAEVYGEVESTEIEITPEKTLDLSEQEALDSHVLEAIEKYPDLTPGEAIAKTALDKGYEAIQDESYINILEEAQPDLKATAQDLLAPTEGEIQPVTETKPLPPKAKRRPLVTEVTGEVLEKGAATTQAEREAKETATQIPQEAVTALNEVTQPLNTFESGDEVVDVGSGEALTLDRVLPGGNAAILENSTGQTVVATATAKSYVSSQAYEAATVSKVPARPKAETTSVEDLKNAIVEALAKPTSGEALLEKTKSLGKSRELSSALRNLVSEGRVKRTRTGGQVIYIRVPGPITKTAERKAAVARRAVVPAARKAPGTFFLQRSPNNQFEVSKLQPAKTVEEFKNRIDQLNKYAQSHAILRRTGGVARKAAGQFVPPGKSKKAKGVAKEGEVRLKDKYIQNDSDYMEVLSHELGHAMEFNLTGQNRHRTYELFGHPLTAEQVTQLTSELKAVTESLVGKGEYNKKLSYYNRRTELFARFLEKMIVAPSNLADIAPLAVELFEKNSILHPLLRDFTEAAMENIDKGAKKAPLADLRTLYQKHLGVRVGNIAYDAEVVHRAMQLRGEKVLTKLLKAKFKGVKDSPATLFRAAESIKITRNGDPVFGTRDYATSLTDAEEVKLVLTGWKKINTEVQTIDGKPTEVPVYARTRYTAAEGQAIYESLSDKGKELIKDFTAAKDEARDYFNREIIKDIHKIETKMEGWVHHYFEDKPATTKGGLKFRKKKAGATKFRKGVGGYVEDFQKATAKAMFDLESAKTFNEFMVPQFARVTKPIRKGESPDGGWVEVQGTLKKGIGTPAETKLVIVKEGKAFVAKQTRYQMPKDIYERYQLMKGAVEEASTALKVVNNLNRWWRVNILTHAGTAGTNFISGGIQFSAKVLTDFYTEALGGKVAFTQTRKNVSAMLKVLLPKGWSEKSPDWVWGGHLSNYYGQFTTQNTGKTAKAIDAYGDKALKLFGAYERYWKKVIATSENVSDLTKLEKIDKEGLKLPTKEEKALIASINSEVDLYAYDYDNVPVWLENYQQSAVWQSVKPFAKYPYKYAQQVTKMVSEIFDQTIPWQRRVARLMALATMMSLYTWYSKRRKELQQSPEGTEKTPARLRTTGRLFVKTDEDGNEIFLRTSKYPFINLTEAGIQMVNGQWESAKDIFTDMVGSLSPISETVLLALDYRNKYEIYTPIPVILGETASSFIPLTRIWRDWARALDPYRRMPKTFFQSFAGELVPTTDEDLQTKLHGEKRVVRIPVEGDVSTRASEGKTRTTTDRFLRNYWQDILLSSLTGLYTTRINPDYAKAFITREKKNTVKKQKAEEKSAYEKYLESQQ